MSSGLMEPVQCAARAEACMSANACIGCRSERRSRPSGLGSLTLPPFSADPFLNPID